MSEINPIGKALMPKPFPVIKKTGVISPNGGEMSVFIYKGKLMRLHNCWEGEAGYPGPCAVIADYFTNETYPPFGDDDNVFYQAYCENDHVYVYAAKENSIYLYDSTDLYHWEKSLVITFPKNFKLHNTAVAKGDNGRYMMAIEAGQADDEFGNVRAVPNEYVGQFFTEFFAKSYDLKTWELLPFEQAYTKERYNACPAMEFCDGYYYMICLEELPVIRYAPYIYRTKDFIDWEVSIYNPILMPSEEDRHPKVGCEDRFTPDEIQRIAVHMNVNNSDIDICEYDGKVYIVYSTGDQKTYSAYAEAVFDGTMEQFLKGFF